MKEGVGAQNFDMPANAGLIRFLHPPTGREMLAQSSSPAEKPLGSHLDAILSKHFQNLFRWP
jgi:hypothetical protein